MESLEPRMRRRMMALCSSRRHPTTRLRRASATTAYLLDWVRRAESSGIRMLKNFAKTIRVHALQILAYYDYPITTGCCTSAIIRWPPSFSRVGRIQRCEPP